MSSVRNQCPPLVRLSARVAECVGLCLCLWILLLGLGLTGCSQPAADPKDSPADAATSDASAPNEAGNDAPSGNNEAGAQAGVQREEAASGSADAPQPSSKAMSTARDKMEGRWLRPDGGYVLEVKQIGDDGRAEVRYFNPRPINVAKAELRTEGKEPALFVEFDDAGYHGSTYTLLYSQEHDALYGIYFQAAAGQRFEVMFTRTEN
ncbi:MAG: hypothetical protein ACOY3P_19105 [Planctomycetota bacterium]